MNGKLRRAVDRRSIKLLTYQWVALDYIAHSTGSFCTTGTRKGNRSWRVLLRRIAEGQLVVSSHNAEQPKLAPLEVPKSIQPPEPSAKRGPGRPIVRTEPVPAPKHWELIEKASV